MSLTKEEQKILSKIPEVSYNDPNKPEFPDYEPNFPATPTYKIEVPGFSNVWLKDESYNPTGTHKDRMGWEIIVTYGNILKTKEKGLIDGPLPSMSIISSGSAALAIQNMLKKYGLPPLKVILDYTTEEKIVEGLEKLGAEIYTLDLSKKELSPTEILHITNNPNGIDITSSGSLQPTTRFYDWLSFEIINNSPQRCFIPFGTGILYENIMNVTRSQLYNKQKDPRYLGDIEILPLCNFIGATTNNPESLAVKLYSPHLPFSHFNEQWIKTFKQSGFCGQESDVYTIQESLLDEAMKILQNQGIKIEPSAAAGLAMLLQMKSKVPHDDKIVIVSTGMTKWDSE